MKNKDNKQIIKAMIFLIGIFLVSSFASASYLETNYYTSGTSASFINTADYYSTQNQCSAGNDLLIQIAPFGCTPAVVRSDLLEEQNVPVFCQIAATKINPLIDINAVDTISFSGQYPPEVSGVGFHPARAALGVEGDLNSPVLNNIGYAVIVLKQNENESSMPDYVGGNLTARISYNIQNALGIGRANFYLPEMTDSEFARLKDQYSFWERRAYIRADSVDDGSAVVSVYDKDGRIASVGLKKGETSDKISLPTLDECLAKFQLKLDDLVNPDTRAKLNINGDIVQVGKGESFLDGRCTVRDIANQGINQKVTINCREDSTSTLLSGSSTFNLMITPRINLTICKKDDTECTTKAYTIGDYLYQTDDSNKKYVYLGYAEYRKDSAKEDLYVVLIERKDYPGSKLSEDDINSMATRMTLSQFDKSTTVPLVNDLADGLGKILGAGINIGKWIANGDYVKITSMQNGKNEFFSKLVTVNGFAEPVDVDLSTLGSASGSTTKSPERTKEDTYHGTAKN